jgi:WASH complex subunit 7
MFDSLHWFESVEAKFEQEEEKLTVVKASEEMQKMQNMSLKKISVFRQEFELLRYCFLGARIFFNNS